ncbi:MAG: C4-type zinc ribbon domain-containing protein [Nitrospiraceae bacterium]
MNSHLPRLIELQAIDLRIAEIKHQRRLIPDRLAAAHAPLRSAAEAMKQAADSVETLTKERRTCERELDTQESHIEKMKARTAEIKTNKEYQAHLFEIEMANKKKGEVEEKILGLMETIERFQREMATAQARVREAEAAYEREQRLLAESDAGLSQELVELDRQQRQAATAVPRDLLDRYEKLKAQRKDHALAAVRDGTCQGCRLQLPPQLIAEVKRSDQLQVCDYCHRILYWEGELPVEAPATAGSAHDHDDEAGESL